MKRPSVWMQTNNMKMCHLFVTSTLLSRTSAFHAPLHMQNSLVQPISISSIGRQRRSALLATNDERGNERSNKNNKRANKEAIDKSSLRRIKWDEENIQFGKGNDGEEKGQASVLPKRKGSEEASGEPKSSFSRHLREGYRTKMRKYKTLGPNGEKKRSLLPPPPSWDRRSRSEKDASKRRKRVGGTSKKSNSVKARGAPFERKNVQPPTMKMNKKSPSSKRLEGNTNDSIGSVSSFLPPPISSGERGSDKPNKYQPSWGDFFANGQGSTTRTRKPNPQSNKPLSRVSKKNANSKLSEPLSSKSSPSPASPSQSTIPALDGVLPVSELFYRSTQSIVNGDYDDQEEEVENSKDTDEELPFSAEQSDRLTTTNNKIQYRSNIKEGQDGARYKTDLAKMRSKESAQLKRAQQKRGNRRKRYRDKKLNKNPAHSGRKMIRRGMEMLVGGEPINADPPQRVVELHYCVQTANELLNIDDEGVKKEDSSGEGKAINRDKDWANVITTNSRDFGPLLCKPSVSKVSTVSRQLYCEHFVSASMKWKICPKDLHQVVSDFQLDKVEYEKLSNAIGEFVSDAKPSNAIEELEEQKNTVNEEISTTNGSKKGFGKNIKQKKGKKKQDTDVEESRNFSGEMGFSFGISLEDFVSGTEGGKSELHNAFKRVLSKGINNAVNSKKLGFNFRVVESKPSDNDDDSTKLLIIFTMMTYTRISENRLDSVYDKFNRLFLEAMEDGTVGLAVGEAAKAETAWSAELRDRIYMDCQGVEKGDQIDDGSIDDEDDFESQREAIDENLLSSSSLPKETKEFDGPFGMPGDTVYAMEDIYLGEGNGGVFPNYSENSIKMAPFKGVIGPLLLDATIERAIQRQPRVIAIGDVHGCIDELQALLRKCDYRPGDLIVFLGDLVSKGPDSVSVVQMARELGALGVRGNHDFEVIRWHQAIKSGADPPVIGSEHYSIASSMDTKNLKWMYSLPWYISSKDLGALFVHAGFVSGIRLGKQNPRLMMNMRSILPDGTVTSKFFNNWPWARLWDGPQTVLFGHDADRGLQQYEHAIGLDTGCVYGGRLTACILPEKRLVSVSAKREYFQYRRKHFD